MGNKSIQISKFGIFPKTEKSIEKFIKANRQGKRSAGFFTLIQNAV